jgi:hypothetical protein
MKPGGRAIDDAMQSSDIDAFLHGVREYLMRHADSLSS